VLELQGIRHALSSGGVAHENAQLRRASTDNRGCGTRRQSGYKEMLMADRQTDRQTGRQAGRPAAWPGAFS
jgi:hypothetical protein